VIFSHNLLITPPRTQGLAKGVVGVLKQPTTEAGQVDVPSF
jgi:hypothetical protein